MRYIIRHTESNPDGETCGTSYFVAETEREMERICRTFREGHPYNSITCLGPVMSIPKWMNDIIKRTEK